MQRREEEPLESQILRPVTMMPPRSTVDSHFFGGVERAAADAYPSSAPSSLGMVWEIGLRRSKSREMILRRAEMSGATGEWEEIEGDSDDAERPRFRNDVWTSGSTRASSPQFGIMENLRRADWRAASREWPEIGAERPGMKRTWSKRMSEGISGIQKVARRVSALWRRDSKESTPKQPSHGSRSSGQPDATFGDEDDQTALLAPLEYTSGISETSTPSPRSGSRVLVSGSESSDGGDDAPLAPIQTRKQSEATKRRGFFRRFRQPAEEGVFTLDEELPVVDDSFSFGDFCDAFDEQRQKGEFAARDNRFRRSYSASTTLAEQIKASSSLRRENEAKSADRHREFRCFQERMSAKLEPFRGRTLSRRGPDLWVADDVDVDKWSCNSSEII